MQSLLFAALCYLAIIQSTDKEYASRVFSKLHTEHNDSLRHSHTYQHRNEDTGEFALVRYNATKCPSQKYLVIENALRVECFTPEVIRIEFSSANAAKVFLAKASRGRVLMSHPNLTCSGSGEGVLLKITQAESSAERIVDVRGAEVQPFELFKHMDAEFSTNMLSSSRCPRQGQTASNTMRPTSVGESPEFSTEKADCDTETYVGPWKIPLPSDVLWQDPSAARMFCIDCSMHFFPVVKFKIRISNYRLEEFVLLYESTTVLNLEPHVSFDANQSSQSMELYKDYLEQLLQQFRLTFHVGGVPIEIDPGLRLGIFMFITANIEAKIGYKASLLGTFKGGIEYDGAKGLQNHASADFHSVPANYKLMLGKKCKIYSKPRGDFVKNVEQCANLCDKYLGCQYFSYDTQSKFCTLTRECEQEANTSSTDLVFESSKWEIPPPNPELKGIISFGFMPEIYLKINRIGGPNLALCIAQTLQLFSYNIESQCSVSSLSTKVSYLVGGNLHLQLGQATLLQMQEYLQPVYTQSLPISGAFEICRNAKVPKTALSLPWIPESSNSPKSLDDALGKSLRISNGLQNFTSTWTKAGRSSLAAHLKAIQKLDATHAVHGEKIQTDSNNRFTAFFSKVATWIKRKMSFE